MNAKRALKAVGEALGHVFMCNPLHILRWQSVVALALVGVALIAAKSTDDMLPSERPTLDHVKPVNSPSFESHKDEGARVCKGRIVPSGPGKLSAFVVVVGQDGRTVLMDTGEAWDRNESKNEFDNVWVIGVCKKHIQKN